MTQARVDIATAEIQIASVVRRVSGRRPIAAVSAAIVQRPVVEAGKITLEGPSWLPIRIVGLII